MGSFLKWLRKPYKKVAKTAVNYLPVVKVIQAGHGVLKVGQAVNQCIDVGDTINETIPAMRVMVGSFCDKIVWISSFATLVQAAGIAAKAIQTYQGIAALNKIEARLGEIGDSLEAQTALKARTEFADLVYDELWYRLMETSQDEEYNHWYIVYHPDTIWYAHFNRRMREKPLSRRFCGYTNCLDMAVIFMLAVRERLDAKQRSAESHSQPVRTTKLHLLIPAYRLLFIPDFVKFPGNLSCFVVESATHHSKHLVWLNIPEEQNRFLSNIENWKPPQATLRQQWAAFLGLATLPRKNTEPRILGPRQEEDEDDDRLSVSSSILRDFSEYNLDDTLPDDDFSNRENESHAEGYSSSNNHFLESSPSHRRDYRENRSGTRGRRNRYHKSREIRNTHKSRGSSRRTR